MEKVCKHCGVPIFWETDHMITCGGAFPVWYSIFDNRRSMRCGNTWQAHEPAETA